jgi:hypothetical protein
LLHPRLRFENGDLTVRGRDRVLDHLRGHPTPRPPTEVEVRDGLLLRWHR